MAFTTRVYVTISPGARNQPNGADHRHATFGPSVDLSISMDATKVTTHQLRPPSA